MKLKRTTGGWVIGFTACLLTFVTTLIVLGRKKDAISPVQGSEVKPSASLESAALPIDPTPSSSADEVADKVEASLPAPTAEVEKSDLLRAEKVIAFEFRGFIANKPQLAMPEEQAQIIATDLIKYTHIKAEFEKNLVQVGSYDGTELVVAIHPYPIEGKALKEAFYRQLNEDLGPEVLENLIAHDPDELGGFFENELSGFGKYEQAYRLRRSPNNPNDVMLDFSWKLPSDYVPASGEGTGGGGDGNSASAEFWGGSRFGSLHEVMTAYFGGK